MCGFGAGLHKDTHDLGLQFRKIEHKYGTAGMKNQIRCRREEIQMAAKRLAHASLDAIALVGLAQDFAYGEPEPWRMLVLCRPGERETNSWMRTGACARQRKRAGNQHGGASETAPAIAFVRHAEEGSSWQNGGESGRS